MPLAPFIGAGADIIGTGINAIAQGQANRDNWAHTKEMYGWQRADALADRDFQNAYNSPGEQMKRLKAAGLNPNLVYGNGSQVSSSQMPRAASGSGAATNVAPRIDLSSIGTAFMQSYQMGVMQAQKNALDQRAILDATKERTEYWKGRSQSAAALMGEAKIPFAGGMAADAASILSAQSYKLGAEGNLAATLSEIAARTAEDKVAQAMQDTIIKKAIATKTQNEADLIAQKVKSETFLTDVKAFQSRMANANINPNQPAWQQALMLLLKKFGIDIFNF